MIWLWACSTPTCPEGSPDPRRLARIQALAPSVQAACFGDRSGLVGDAVVLDKAASDEDLAARAVHLSLHARAEQPAPGAECEAQWLEFEVTGWSAELSQRKRQDLPATFPFEAAWRQTGSDDVIRRWLVENPDGGGGVDGLMAGYAQRCVP